ncbi:hypothetical protein M422DRAFT_252141 [Sphaerobolus stellatus SS14]|uniref:Uncharacterized protein n=1 Tax=Sphaerobolus stellatus (strain SS14) TaxID=990650 RepID=A0A0C9W0U6_SPHS4|nr:hypothetical protein M422DRAFT_252141 [Sphaerobolus stellatus SS14]
MKIALQDLSYKISTSNPAYSDLVSSFFQLSADWSSPESPEKFLLENFRRTGQAWEGENSGDDQFAPFVLTVLREHRISKLGAALAKSLPESTRIHNAAWLKIPLVVDDAGQPLLTIGEVEDQAKTRGGRVAKLVAVKTESQGSDIDPGTQQPSKSAASKLAASKPAVDTKNTKRREPDQDESTVAETNNPKLKKGWTGYGPNRLRNNKGEVVKDEVGEGRNNKQPKSREFIEISDEDVEISDTEAPTATSNPTPLNDVPKTRGLRPKPRPVVVKETPTTTSNPTPLNDIPKTHGPRPKPRPVVAKGKAAAHNDPSLPRSASIPEETKTTGGNMFGGVMEDVPMMEVGGDMFGGGAMEDVSTMEECYAGQQAIPNDNAILHAPIAGPSIAGPSQARPTTARAPNRRGSVMGPRPLPCPPQRPLPIASSSFNGPHAPAVPLPGAVYTAPTYVQAAESMFDFNTYGALHTGYPGLDGHVNMELKWTGLNGPWQARHNGSPLVWFIFLY